MILFFLPVEMLFKFAKEFQGLWIIHYKMSTYKCNIYGKNIPEIFRILKLYYYTPSQKVKQIVSSTNTPDYFAIMQMAMTAHAAKEIQWQKFNSWKLQSPLIVKILNGEVLSNLKS